MEFFINHTRQEIFRAPSDEWEEDDEIEKDIVHLDIEEEFCVMVKLIDEYGYYMEPDDRAIFMKDIDMERLVGEQYDEMLRLEEADAESTGQWGGWDEPGASCDY